MTVAPVTIFQGVVRIFVVEARNLENKDISFIKKGKSDPYAIVTVGNQTFKTRTIDNDLNPKWNEFYEAVVQSASSQRVRVELYDEDPGNADDELGRVSLELDDVRAKGMIDAWYPLEGAEKGDLHLRIYWMSLTRDPRDFDADVWDNAWLNANRPMHSALLTVYVDSATDLPVSEAAFTHKSGCGQLTTSLTVGPGGQLVAWFKGKLRQRANRFASGMIVEPIAGHAPPVPLYRLTLGPSA